MKKDLVERKDIQASNRDYKNKNPDKKFEVTNFGTKAFILLRDPQLVKDFTQRPGNYEKHQLFQTMRILLGDGLILTEGEVWKRHRKIISGSFHYEFLKNNAKNVQNTTQEFFNKLTKEEMKNYDVMGHIQAITGEVVGRLFFGEKLNNYTFEGKPLTLALADLLSELGASAVSPLVILFGPKFLTYPIVPKFKKMMTRIKEFRQLCIKIVEDRKAHPVQGNDLLTSLLANQSSSDNDLQLSDQEIIDEFITFFGAGMDTTGHLITMALYNLTQHPQHLEELKKERDLTYNKKDVSTADALQDMNVMHCFLKETLRHYGPAIGIPARLVVNDHMIGDLKISKGDVVRTDFYPLFMDEKTFKNATEFDPKRWSDPNLKLDSFAFTPFSAGPRNCIGQHLAILESKLIISEFLERFDFKLKDGYDLKMTLRFLYEPVDKVVFELTPKIGC
jgi:cytochrome P450 family 4 subfamily V